MSEKIIPTPADNNDDSYILKILYEDDSILIADKPAGILSLDDSTDRKSMITMVKDYLKKTIGGNRIIYCAPIHRLDRPVSGTMLFTKTYEAARKLSNDMRNGKIKKIYCALVNPIINNTAENTWTFLEQYYVRRRDRAYIVGANMPRAAAVSLRYRFLKKKEIYNSVLIDLITGKRHQIRVQLSSLGMPIIGDRFYGSKETIDDGIICLHALSLKLIHPVSLLQMKIISPLPAHFTERIGSLDLIDTGLIDN
jgi:23S rRNA pseudouridine1911/1915/1917 synthase